MTRYAGMRVVVVGLGASGFAAARALLELEAKVKVTDDSGGALVAQRAATLRSSGADVEIGGHDLDALDGDLAVISPGVPPGAPVVRALIRMGIPVIGEVELAWRLARCDFLAVTGTNGKTTTTSLLAAMLADSGIPSLAAGNIGLPLVEAVARVPAGGAIAVEVSSFQLAAIDAFRAKVAVVLNIAEDHTDWHGSSDEYWRAKARIVENQTPDDVFLPNLEDERVVAMAASTRGRVAPFSATRPPTPGGARIGVRGSTIVWRDEPLMSLGEIALPGAAGAEDVVAAAGAALEYGIDRNAVIGAASAFRPLRHRLETIAESGGVRYIDDSKATNPHATLAALHGMRDVVLIAGGRSKGIDLAPLAGAASALIAVVALGEAAEEIRDVMGASVPVDVVRSMDEAVSAAQARSIPGGSVLLSPACASLDMYTSYAERGDAFARAVRAMTAQEGRPSGNES
ncbi:MAG: UDP-N-acetylmuramoyl-L-alanine--D-glutamate ligase [Actinomycetota bacterium]|nr:UDP-N-acetylmuramoyl-L-alanine--D-glutamate ligase [Actinomycetota bacterium]